MEMPGLRVSRYGRTITSQLCTPPDVVFRRISLPNSVNQGLHPARPTAGPTNRLNGSTESLTVRPHIPYQKRQVVHPIVFTYSSRINDMRKVILAVGDYEICVRHCVIATRRSGLCRDREARGPLDCLNGRFRPGEADESTVKKIQPSAQDLWCISGRISCDENKPNPIGNRRGHLLQARRQIRHMHRALIGAVRVSEKQERHIAVGALPEIKGRAGGIGEDKARLGQRR